MRKNISVKPTQEILQKAQNFIFENLHAFFKWNLHSSDEELNIQNVQYNLECCLNLGMIKCKWPEKIWHASRLTATTFQQHIVLGIFSTPQNNQKNGTQCMQKRWHF